MDCLLNNTFPLTFKTLVWSILYVQGLGVVSCCEIFRNPPQHYSKCLTRADQIGKCLDEGLEPTYYLSIFANAHNRRIYPYIHFEKKSCDKLKIPAYFKNFLQYIRFEIDLYHCQFQTHFFQHTTIGWVL